MSSMLNYGRTSVPLSDVHVHALTAMHRSIPTLSDAERAVCAATGIAPEAFAACKRQSSDGPGDSNAGANPKVPPSDEAYGLSPEELAICDRVGISPEDFAKAKKAAAADRAARE